MADHDHRAGSPAYKGQTLVVFERLHCGQIQANSQARPALPNIEFTVYRLPSPSMPSGLRIPASLPGGVAQFRGVNILSATWDFLTARAGPRAYQRDSSVRLADQGGRPRGRHQARVRAVWREAYLPLLTGQQDADKIIQDALQYLDGWVYTEAGKIRSTIFPNDGTLPGSLRNHRGRSRRAAPRFRRHRCPESPTTIVVELLEGDGANSI